MSTTQATSQTTTQHHRSVLAAQKQRTEIEELDATIGRLSRHMNSCNYQLMMLIREFDERGGWLKWGFTDALSWLRWRCDLSANAARDKLRVAHALKKLSIMSKEFERGAMSYSKVRSLTRIATAENEQELITIASNLSVANVEAYCRQRINTSKAATAQANQAHENRALRLWRNEATGLMNLSIELTLEEGALFEQAVEKASVQLAADNANTPEKMQEKDASWHALQADAAMLIIRDYLSGESSGNETSRHSSSADLYQVVVHVDEDALVKGPCDGGTSTSQVPVDTARRLCCDGSIVPIIENAKGEPLSVGRKVRTITPAIRRALWSRDKGCAYPGCECRRYVDAHHIKHWANGGETAIDNLVLLCTKHHRLVHEGGYSIEFDHMQKRFFRRPDGRAVPKCGYRLDDWQDDYSNNVDWADLVSTDFGFTEAKSGGTNLNETKLDNSVAEESGIYSVDLNIFLGKPSNQKNSREVYSDERNILRPSDGPGRRTHALGYTAENSLVTHR